MTVHRFGEFSLDTRTYELRRHGAVIPVEPQVFGVLRHLIENHDRVVSKDELIDVIWNGRIVSDATLSSRIRAARRAVHDTGKAQKVIRTVPRRGFRFVAQLDDEGKVVDSTVEPETPTSLPLPDKPSIAVLPFANMSGDPEQEYFAAGIAEDIITALSRFHWFFVIARNSSFTYKGHSVDVTQVARELGVQYVLEGSVRKAGNRIRITAQLVDALTGRHVWAERFDRELLDIFAVQDEIAESITAAVAPSFVSAEARRAERKAPEGLDAWDYAIRGNWYFWRLGKEDLTEARRLFQIANDLDPQSSIALCGLALVTSWEVMWGWAENPKLSWSVAYEFAQRAVAVNEQDAWAYATLGFVSSEIRQNDTALRALHQAIELNPNLAFAEGALALSHAHLSDPHNAVVHAQKADRLSPFDPARVIWNIARFWAAFITDEFQLAAEWGETIVEANPDFPSGHRMLAACYAHLDRMDDAHAAIERLLHQAPHHSISWVRSSHPAADLELYLNGLRKAGLPE